MSGPDEWMIVDTGEAGDRRTVYVDRVLSHTKAKALRVDLLRPYGADDPWRKRLAVMPAANLRRQVKPFRQGRRRRVTVPLFTDAGAPNVADMAQLDVLRPCIVPDENAEQRPNTRKDAARRMVMVPHPKRLV